MPLINLYAAHFPEALWHALFANLRVTWLLHALTILFVPIGDHRTHSSSAQIIPKTAQPAVISTAQNVQIPTVVTPTTVPNAKVTIPHSSVLSPHIPFNPLPPSAPSPVNIANLAHELNNYEKTAKTVLLSSLRNGFDIGYRGPHFSNIAHNLKSAFQHPAAIWSNNISELKEKRIAGPFYDPPLANFRTSPVGIVPKKYSNKFRTITDLSSPEGLSVNEFIPQSESSVQFNHFDKAVQIVARLGTGALLAKLDVKSAFRICPVRRQDWHLLGFPFRVCSLLTYAYPLAYGHLSIVFPN